MWPAYNNSSNYFHKFVKWVGDILYGMCANGHSLDNSSMTCSILYLGENIDGNYVDMIDLNS